MADGKATNRMTPPRQAPTGSLREQTRGERACTTWSLLASAYDPETPTPAGFSPDIKLSLNGMPIAEGVAAYRNMMAESLRRHPDWLTTLIQEFGDDNGACTVWHGTANRDAPDDEQVSMHGVTILDVDEDDMIVGAHFYFESDDDSTAYGSVLNLRLV